MWAVENTRRYARYSQMDFWKLVFLQEIDQKWVFTESTKQKTCMIACGTRSVHHLQSWPVVYDTSPWVKYKAGSSNAKDVMLTSSGLGTRHFYFQDRKIEISGHFSGHQSHKTRFFVISVAYNFGTFRAEAKVTIRRHELVYRLSSERKMIDLEWSLHAILMLKSWTTLLSLFPVLLTHKQNK